MKYLFGIFYILNLIPSLINAQPGCLECVAMAEVHCKLKKGDAFDGYVALSGTYTNKSNFELNENMIPSLNFSKINPTLDNSIIKIKFASKRYDLKTIAILYVEEDVKSIPLEDFKEIRFIKWLEGFSNYKIPSISQNKMNLLLNKPVINKIVIDDGM